MKLIVGLGNPGEKYQNTRHNLGFWVVEKLLRELTPVKKSVWRSKKRLKSEIARVKTEDTEVILAKPLVSMNTSGEAVKKLVQFYHLNNLNNLNNLYIIHDDLDLPVGKIKIAKGRGAAGHRGVASVVQSLGTPDFVRFRLGIGRPKKGDKWWVSLGGLTNENVKHQEVSDFVLGEFEKKEAVEAKKMVKKAVKLILFTLKNGLAVSNTQ